MLFQQQFAILGGANVARPITYRASVATLTSATVGKPAGVAVGDLAFVVCPDEGGTPGSLTLTTTSGSVWTRLSLPFASGGYNSVLFWKILNAADVANAWTASNALDYAAYAYQPAGFASLASRATTANPISQSSLTLAGFNPASDCKGAITVAIDRDTDTTSAPPTNFTKRAQTALTNFRVSVADPTTDYASVPITWTGLQGASGNAEAGWFLEVL